MIVEVDGIRPGWQNKAESALFYPNVFLWNIGVKSSCFYSYTFIIHHSPRLCLKPSAHLYNAFMITVKTDEGQSNCIGCVIGSYGFSKV